MTSAPAPRRWGRWSGVALASIWLVFLLAPARAVWAHPDVTRRAVGAAALLVFAAAYIAVFARQRRFGAFTPDDDGLHDRPGAYATLGPMVAALLVLVPIIGNEITGLAVFLCAAGAVELTARRSAAVAVSMALATGVIAVQERSMGLALLPVICIITWLSLWFSRRIASDNARLRRAEGELASMRVLAERERVARDVHDILGHTLTVLAIKAQVADRLIDDDPERAHAEMAEIEALTRNALGDVRSTVTRLRVPELAEQVAASRTAARAAGLDFLVEGDSGGVPEERRPLFAWVLREALTNVIRHAGATQVRVRVTPAALSVSDDGIGIGDVEPGGNGLRGLRERARSAGAELTVAPGRPHSAHPGTRVEVSFP